MALEVFSPRSAVQIVGVVACDTRDGYGCSLPAGAYTVEALNKADAWYWSTTDGLPASGMTPIAPGGSLAVTGPAASLYFKGDRPINLRVTFAPPLAVPAPAAVSVLVGNTTFVDVVNGLDLTGIRGDQTLPFKTITAARAASVAGDTIVVWPGTYSEGVQFKAGVRLHGMLGAKITRSAPGQYCLGDFGVAITDARVSGDFVFEASGGAGVFEFEAASTIAIECSSAEVISGSGILVAAFESGSFTLRAKSFLASATGPVVSIGGGAPQIVIEAARSITGNQILVDAASAGASRVSIKAPTITASISGDYGVSIAHAAAAWYDISADALTTGVLLNAASAEVHTHARTHTPNTTGIGTNAVTAGTMFASADEFVGLANLAPIALFGAGAVLHLLRGRVRAQSAQPAVKFLNSAAQLLVYPGTVLIAGAAALISIDVAGGVTPTVVAMGVIAANKDADVGVTVAVGSLLVDAAVV